MNYIKSLRDFFFNNRENLYFICLALLVIGMPTSAIVMSISQFMIAGTWIIEGQYKEKIYKFITNKTALVLSSIYLMHVLGMLYTDDFQYGLKDLRIKLPLLLFPFLFCSMPNFTIKKLYILLQLFTSSILVVTFIGIYKLLYTEIIDIREISPYISHIRLSLYICISIFILFYFIYEKNSFNQYIKLLFFIIIIWFIIYLIILQSITGLIILLFISFILSLVLILKNKKILTKLTILIFIVFSLSLIYMYINNIYKDYNNANKTQFSNLATFTKSGNPYFHDTTNTLTENGNYVWINICWIEMQESWNKRSNIKFEEKDKKGNLISYTILRFLASKGLTKDAEGINKLTNHDINLIEHGYANINFENKISITNRIYQILSEIDVYKKYNYANGSSIIQRLIYWKTSINIIKDNLLLGVGTGDINIAFKDQYEKDKTNLDTKWRLRSHNQFLAITVAFGIVGLIWFLIFLFYPFVNNFRHLHTFYIIFILVAILSMFTEDTLETQAGVTFFGFFSCLFLFQNHFIKNIPNRKEKLS